MFCTNCGEQMRDTDKFCAECGAAASPRTVKKRAASVAAVEQPAPPRAPQSTAEAYHAPLPATPSGARSAGQPELAFSAPAQQGPAPASGVRQAPPSPLSDQQQQQVLLEAEEIASVRGTVPIEVLPEIVPATAGKAAAQAVAQTCSACGRVNPAENYFCEGCGRALQAASARPVPAPITQTSWLNDNQPAPPAARVASAAPRVEAPAAPAPAPAPATATNDNFFYYYDDKASHRGNRKLLVVLVVVLVLAIGGVAYLMLRPSAKSASAGDVIVTIAPTEARVAAGGTQDFAATVKGTGDIDVTWSVAEGNTGGTLVNRGAQAEGGSVATMAIYAAPTAPGTYHVVATSKADPAKAATAEVTVTER
jgi:zinc-ribbon domain